VSVLTEKILSIGNYKCKALLNEGKGAPIVFLHGYSYTREVWKSISVTELLKEKHVPFLALDMPYGSKSECKPKTRDVEANVAFAREATESAFGSAAPVVVGASLGGHISLMYAAQFPVRGLLLVSPTRVFHEALVHAYQKFTFPVRIIWGSEDTIVSGEDMRNLTAKLPNAKLLTYEGAGHSAYRNQPDRFKRDLLELYAAAELT
jgi:pimeloyl-ACP methyl ester carboxylesterase